MLKPIDSTGDAPRCPTCGYLLLGLPEYRCPECGTSFNPEFVEDASFRTHLLPWERPEAGGRVKRLAKTLVQASFHPGRFFTSVSKRKDVRIAHAGKLIAACVLASLCFYACGFLVQYTGFFVRFLVPHGQPSRALGMVLRIVSITWSTDLQLPLMQVLSVLLSVVVMAALISRLFRGKLGSLRSLDIAAVHSSAVAFGAFIAAFAQVVVAVFFDSLYVVVYGAVWGPDGSAATTAVVHLSSVAVAELVEGCWNADYRWRRGIRMWWRGILAALATSAPHLAGNYMTRVQ